MSQAAQNKSIVGILLCAGLSSRMGFDKLTAELCGKTPLLRSIDALIAGGCTKIVATVNAQTRAYLQPYATRYPLHPVDGGKTRFESVYRGLCAANGDIALIHDAARCLVGANLVHSCIDAALEHGSGVAAMPMTDTVLRERDGKFEPVPRQELWRMQTPQAFDYEMIRAAYAAAQNAACGGADGDKSPLFTDDASVWLWAGHAPHIVLSNESNIKLTTPADLTVAQTLLRRAADTVAEDLALPTHRAAKLDAGCPVFGIGYDTHILVEGRKLILGGVDVPFERGLLGHSDADVLLHAVCDAILGACALGDIGRHFPDTDPRFLGADSRTLLRAVGDMVQKRDMRVLRVDAVIVCQRPKLAPYIPQMRVNIASDLALPADCVSVKATTTEGMNDEGRGLCVSAQAIATVR